MTRAVSDRMKLLHGRYQIPGLQQIYLTHSMKATGG